MQKSKILRNLKALDLRISHYSLEELEDLLSIADKAVTDIQEDLLSELSQDPGWTRGANLVLIAYQKSVEVLEDEISDRRLLDLIGVEAPQKECRGCIELQEKLSLTIARHHKLCEELAQSRKVSEVKIRADHQTHFLALSQQHADSRKREVERMRKHFEHEVDDLKDVRSHLAASLSPEDLKQFWRGVAEQRELRLSSE